MDIVTAEKAVTYLLKSKGRNKLLSIYGGEPLLNFDLLKKIVPFALSLAKSLNKNLTINLCTNGTLLKEEHISFFKKFDIKLIISMAGNRNIHDKFRFTESGKGTYDLIKHKFAIISRKLASDNVGLSLCVFPSTSKKIYSQFNHLLKLGFKYINFEIIREYEPWIENNLKYAVIEFIKIIKKMLDKVSQNDYVFLNPICWEIKYSTINKRMYMSCPFNYLLEVYPNGDMVFSPFLLNSSDKAKFIIGNVNNEKSFRFRDCVFNKNNRICKNCIPSYFREYNCDQGAQKVYKIYYSIMQEAAKQIIKYSKSNKKFRNYVNKIKKSICF